MATLEAEGGRWNVPVQGDRADDVAYVADVIAHVAARVCTDEARVYATGFPAADGCRRCWRVGSVRASPPLRRSLGSDFPDVHRSAGLLLSFHGLADQQNRLRWTRRWPRRRARR